MSDREERSQQGAPMSQRLWAIWAGSCWGPQGKRGAQSEWSHAGVEGLHHICFSCPQSLAPDCVPAGNPRLGPGGL